MQKDLDEHALFKRKLGLYAMDMSILSEFNTTNTEQNIGKKIAIMKAIRCNEQIEKQLAKTNSDLAEAKRYEQEEINSIQNDLMRYLYRSFSDVMRIELKRHGNTDRLLRDANCQIKGFIEKKVSII